MIKQLHIYPTSRALREVSSKYKEQNSFLPTLMRMDEFEKRSILLKGSVEVDKLQRILLLREAANFTEFKDLKLELSLIKFFTKSDAIFKFFEELASENVDFKNLAEADAYAEFISHLEILERLLLNYKKLLDKNGFIDKAFIPNSYTLNHGFLNNFDTIEVHLEGYLSHFELSLLNEVAQSVSLNIYYTTSKFNQKMQDRFKKIGINLPNNSHLHFSLTDKKILNTQNNSEHIEAKVFCVEEREEQIAMVFKEIELLVQSGLNPEEIVLILPDENFKEHFMLFDSHNNLNFAMGYDYSRGKTYKYLDALYKYWQSFDDKSKNLLEVYRLKIEDIGKFTPTKKVKYPEFFAMLETLGLKEKEKSKSYERVEEKYIHFIKVLETQELSLKEWLFLWLKSLSKVTLDDVRGGKITVMGVLETRGISFDAVVIVDFNEGVVPASSSKDQFLNSTVRAFANLPTRNDREALQKQYYKRVLEQAKKAIILYTSSDNKLPSKFLYELGLDSASQTQTQFNLLYNQKSKLIEAESKVVEFDPLNTTWSASRLKIFLECKYQYYYRYILKIEQKQQEEMNEGQFLHLVLEKLFNENSYYDSRDEMQKNLDILIDTLHPLKGAKAQYQKLLWREKLKGFVDTQINHFQAQWRVISREQEFQANINGLEFKGRIDRLDQSQTATLVLDYKSGRVEKEPKELNPEKITDFQMPIYYELLKGKYQNISLAYLKIFENGKMQEVQHLEQRVELLKEHIETLKKSTSFIVQKCDESKKCRFCEDTLLL